MPAMNIGQAAKASGSPTILINGKVEENLGTWPALRSRLKELGA